jgi:molybdopterin/thiamine biosynthesis adenylyltransferase
LFFNFKIDGFKVLVSRFNEEQDKENKIVIYNCIRLLISHLELKDLLNVVDQGVLNILVGEYGKEKVLPIEDLGLSNFYLKFF